MGRMRLARPKNEREPQMNADERRSDHLSASICVNQRFHLRGTSRRSRLIHLLWAGAGREEKERAGRTTASARRIGMTFPRPLLLVGAGALACWGIGAPLVGSPRASSGPDPPRMPDARGVPIGTGLLAPPPQRSLVMASDGSLVLLYAYHEKDSLRLRTSPDAGRTWQKELLVAEGAFRCSHSSWGQRTNCEIATDGGNNVYVVYRVRGTQPRLRRLTRTHGTTWELAEEVAIPRQGKGDLGLLSVCADREDRVWVVYGSEEGLQTRSTADGGKNWSEERGIPGTRSGVPQLFTWQGRPACMVGTRSGLVWSTFDGKAWSAPEPVAGAGELVLYFYFPPAATERTLVAGYCGWGWLHRFMGVEPKLVFRQGDKSWSRPETAHGFQTLDLVAAEDGVVAVGVKDGSIVARTFDGRAWGPEKTLLRISAAYQAPGDPTTYVTRLAVPGRIRGNTLPVVVQCFERLYCHRFDLAKGEEENP